MTNDDGVDSVGLHRLAERLSDDHDVVVAAPDREYSGAGAAIGTIHLIEPEVHRIELPGSRRGMGGHRAAGALRDVRPARRVRRPPSTSSCPASTPAPTRAGRSTTPARWGPCSPPEAGRMSGIAVSQAVEGFGVEGQGWDEMLAAQRWDTACEMAAATVDAFTAAPPDERDDREPQRPQPPAGRDQGLAPHRGRHPPAARLGPRRARAEGRPRGHLLRADGLGRAASSCPSTPTPVPSSAATCRSPTSAASPTTRRADLPALADHFADLPLHPA